MTQRNTRTEDIVTYQNRERMFADARHYEAINELRKMRSLEFTETNIKKAIYKFNIPSKCYRIWLDEDNNNIRVWVQSNFFDHWEAYPENMNELVNTLHSYFETKASFHRYDYIRIQGQEYE